MPHWPRPSRRESGSLIPRGSVPCVTRDRRGRSSISGRPADHISRSCTPMGARAGLDHLHTIYPDTTILVSAVRVLRTENPSPRDRARHRAVVAHHHGGLRRALQAKPLPYTAHYQADPATTGEYPDDVWELLRPYIMGEGEYDVRAELELAITVAKGLELEPDAPNSKSKRDPNQP